MFLYVPKNLGYGLPNICWSAMSIWEPISKTKRPLSPSCGQFKMAAPPVDSTWTNLLVCKTIWKLVSNLIPLCKYVISFQLVVIILLLVVFIRFICTCSCFFTLYHYLWSELIKTVKLWLPGDKQLTVVRNNLACSHRKTVVSHHKINLGFT